MFTLDHFPEARPRYTDQISVVAPPGTKTALRRAAEASGRSVPDLLREAIQRVASGPGATASSSAAEAA